MTRPPTFSECTICGREFGSKSIVIHERQCLQKLRRTEILQEAEAQATRKSKKKATTAKSGSNAQKVVMVACLSPDFINLPKIQTKSSPTTSKLQKDKASHHQIRPTTATLSRPQILNPEYIQYDMSLTRIDYSVSSKPKTMDENQNGNNRTHQRQQFDEPNGRNSSNFVLPAVTGISASSTKGKQIKGTNSDYRNTKLPESTMTNLLGEPIKKYIGLADDAILPRYSENFQVRTCSIALPARRDSETFLQLPLPNLLNEFSESFENRVTFTSENDDKYNLPQIQINDRTSDEPNEDDFDFVTSGLNAPALLLPFGPDGISVPKDNNAQQKGEDSHQKTAPAELHNIDVTLPITKSITHTDNQGFPRRSESYPSSIPTIPAIKCGTKIAQKTESENSQLEFPYESTSKSIQEIFVLKQQQPLRVQMSSSESDEWAQNQPKIPKARPTHKRRWKRTKFPPDYVDSGDSESSSGACSEKEPNPKLDSDDLYATADCDCGDAVENNSTESESHSYYPRQAIVRDFERDSDSHLIESGGSDSSSSSNSRDGDSTSEFEANRCTSAPGVMQTARFRQTQIQTPFQGEPMQQIHGMDISQIETSDDAGSDCNDFEMCNKIVEEIVDNLVQFADPPVVITSAAATMTTNTEPAYSTIVDPIPLPDDVPQQIPELDSDLDELENTNNLQSVRSLMALKSILKKRSSTRKVQVSPSPDDSLSPIAQPRKQIRRDHTFTGSDSDDEGSCNTNYSELITVRHNILKRRFRNEPPHLDTRPNQIIAEEKELLESAINEARPYISMQTLQNEYSGSQSQSPTSPPVEIYPPNLVDELSELLKAQLKKQRAKMSGRREQRTHEKVKDWLDACESRPDDPVRIWEGNQPDPGDADAEQENDPEVTEFDSVSSSDPVHNNQVVSGILSAIFRVRELNRGTKIYKFTDSMDVTREPGPHPSKIPKFRKKCPQTPTDTKIKNKMDKDSDRRGAMTSPPLDNKTKKAIEKMSAKGDEKLRPVSARLENRPKTSPPIPKKAVRPGTPQVGHRFGANANFNRAAVPMATLRQTLLGIEPNLPCNKKKFHTQVKSCQVPERRSFGCQSSPPLPEAKPKKLRPKSRKVLPKPVETPRKSALQSQEGTKPKPKPKSARLVHFEDVLPIPIETSNPAPNHSTKSTSEAINRLLFDDDKSGWVEMIANQNTTHTVYQFHTETTKSMPTPPAPWEAPVRETPNPEDSENVGQGCPPEKSEALKALEDIEDQKDKAREKDFDRKKRVREGKSRRYTERPSLFPAMYTLMVPKKFIGEVYVNLSIIIRRKAPDGTLPPVEDIVPEYNPEWMYLIVDEENLTHTSPNPYVLPHLNREAAIRNLEDEDILDDLKIVTSNRSTIDSLSTADAVARFLTCYICGKEFNCREYYEHEIKCKEAFIQRNEYLDKKFKRILPTKPRGVISIQRWNEFAYEATKYKLIKCPLCNKTFLPDREDLIKEHMEECKKRLLDLELLGKDMQPVPLTQETPQFLTLKHKKSGAFRDYDAATNEQLGKRYWNYKKPPEEKNPLAEMIKYSR